MQSKYWPGVLSGIAILVGATFSALLLASPQPAAAATTPLVAAPESLSFSEPQTVCRGKPYSQQVCVKFGKKPVDIVFLVDDTGTFEHRVADPADLRGLMNDLVQDLSTDPALTDMADLGFGVARFEDYRPEYTYGLHQDRPFILNQPVVTETDAAAAGTSVAALIDVALARTAPGDGGDAPEAGEALLELFSGTGFDGDNDGDMHGINNDQRAGGLNTQLNADASGDVPPYASLLPGVVSSGTEGGVGFRSNSIRIVVMLTNWCAAAPFAPGTPLATTSIVGADGVTVPATDFLCYGQLGGPAGPKLRFGEVGVVSPPNASSVTDIIDGLVVNKARVVSIVPGAYRLPVGAGAAAPAVGGFDAVIQGYGNVPFLYYYPSLFGSTISRLSGALASDGTPLVFDAGDPDPFYGGPSRPADAAGIRSGLLGLASGLVAAPSGVDLASLGIASVGTLPGDLTVTQLGAATLNEAGDEVCFNALFSASDAAAVGTFPVAIMQPEVGDPVAVVPVTVNCSASASIGDVAPSPTPTASPGPALAIQEPDVISNVNDIASPVSVLQPQVVVLVPPTLSTKCKQSRKGAAKKTAKARRSANRCRGTKR